MYQLLKNRKQALAIAAVLGLGLLLGEVKLNQDRTVFVTPRLSGLVESVHANAGDAVQRGQLLAVISSQALGDQRAEAQAAIKRLALARTNHERAARLWEERVIAEQAYLAVRQTLHEAEIADESARQKLAALGIANAEGPLTRYEIRSPIAGVIVDKKLSVGEALREDAPIFQVADLSSVWVELTVPTQDLARLKIGAEVQVKAHGLEGQARLSYISALVSEQSRSAMARLLLPNARHQWRPGLPVTVSVKEDEAEAPVTVNTEALQTHEGHTVVFVREGQGFEARVVTTGRADGRLIEVLGGLKAGGRYASRNSFLVKADLGKGAAEHEH